MSYGLVDQTYALGVNEFEANPELTSAERIAYYTGTGLPVFIVWYISTYLGAVFGAQIPPEFALDFAVPISFLALVAPSLKTPAHVAAALTSIVFAIALSTVPYGLGLIIAGMIAMCVGAFVETRLEQRTA